MPGIKYGTTYHSYFKDIHSINNPIVDNDVQMQYTGFFEPCWTPETIDFDAFGYGLKKNLNNNGRILCSDASQLFSLHNGYIKVVLNLPHAIENGIYAPLKNKSTKYSIWSINSVDGSVSMPGIGGFLTKDGIEFSICTSYTSFSIYDTYSNIDANDDFIVEFLWDVDCMEELSRTNMVIFVNKIPIVGGILPIYNHSLTNIPFRVLNNDFEVVIKELKISNERQYHILESWGSSSSSSNSSESWGNTSSSSSS